MPGRRANDFQTFDFNRLPPVHFMDLCERNPPSLQVGANAETHIEMRALGSQVLDSLPIQMIEMVMGDQHGINVREILKCNGWWVKSLDPVYKWNRREHIGENGIRHESQPFDLYQYTGMPKPNSLEPLGSGSFQRARVQLDDWNLELWFTNLTLGI